MPLLITSVKNFLPPAWISWTALLMLCPTYVITKIEVLGFNASDEHSQLLNNFTDDATVLDLTGSIVDVCIEIRKKNKTQLPDAIIAATALVYDLVLISRNGSDFKNIQGFKVINPHNLKQQNPI